MRVQHTTSIQRLPSFPHCESTRPTHRASPTHCATNARAAMTTIANATNHGPTTQMLTDVRGVPD
eukprot:237347-Alexandrium_andersonii.AAC.1